jgi:hypothetical protein
VVAFVTSIVLLLIGVGIIFFVASRRPPGTPLTWAEAIVAGAFVFGVLLLAYGVVPNQWLQWADNQLHWRQDAFGIPTGPLPFRHHVIFEKGITFFGGHGRVLITKQAVRDIIVTMIYVVMLGANLALWAVFQKRGRPKEEVPAIETSTFGRPLVRRV